MPRAKPLTIVTQPATRSPTIASATSRPYIVARRVPTMPTASSSAGVTAPRM